MAEPARVAQRKPNILFIYTDDQAAWTTGFSGNPQARSPNLDRLAREGAIFTNCFVTTPVCSPARASLMTSRYATELGVPDFIPQPGHRFYNAANPIGLDPAIGTFSKTVSRCGYTTGLVGKWHLGDWTQTEDKQYHPSHTDGPDRGDDRGHSGPESRRTVPTARGRKGHASGSPS